MGVNRTSTDQFQLRLPPGLREKLKEKADANSRSMNTEIVQAIEQSFDPLIINVRKTGDFYSEIDRIVERTLRTVREEERNASVIPADDKFEPGIVDALFAFMTEGERSRTEAVNEILREWLSEKGYLKNGSNK